jgi:hypothetical protein
MSNSGKYNSNKRKNTGTCRTNAQKAAARKRRKPKPGRKYKFQ